MPLSFLGKLPVFFDGIDLFPAEAMLIDFTDLAVAEVIGVHIVGIDLQHIDQGNQNVGLRGADTIFIVRDGGRCDTDLRGQLLPGEAHFLSPLP